jgi:hypothetical protein
MRKENQKRGEDILEHGGEEKELRRKEKKKRLIYYEMRDCSLFIWAFYRWFYRGIIK